MLRATKGSDQASAEQRDLRPWNVVVASSSAPHRIPSSTNVRRNAKQKKKEASPPRFCWSFSLSECSGAIREPLQVYPHNNTSSRHNVRPPLTPSDRSNTNCQRPQDVAAWKLRSRRLECHIDVTFGTTASSDWTAHDWNFNLKLKIPLRAFLWSLTRIRPIAWARHYLRSQNWVISTL